MKQMLTIAMTIAAAVALAAPGSKATDGGAADRKSAVSARQDSKASGTGLASARKKISDIVKNPKLMEEAIKGLSPRDQCRFLAEVNQAIAKMSGSNEEKAAIFLNVNRSALDGAAKGNAAAIVAETYATVPVAVLTVINESYASDVFNRAADPNKTYTDEQFIKIAVDVMKVINKRLDSAADANLRSGFAALTMIRASNSESETIRNAIVATLPKGVQETAKNEWFSAALADGDAKSYEPMLGMAETEQSRPVAEEVLRIAGPQQVDAMLSDLSGANTDPNLDPSQAQPVIDSVFAPIQNDAANIGVGDAASGGAAAQVGKVQAEVEEEKRQEFQPYQWQTTK